ncbi:unnamed protein product, partial [Chrysoparadoxa australica]
MEIGRRFAPACPNPLPRLLDLNLECACGEECTSGTVTPQQLAELKAAFCPWTDCPCGNTCGCGSACTCAGSTEKSNEQWIEQAGTNGAVASGTISCT